MKSIIDIMRENSKKLSNPEQIKILREVFEPAFEELINYSEKMYKDLEEKIINEIDIKSLNYQIKTTLIHKDELNYHSLYLTPIIKKDTEDIDKNILLYDIQNKGRIFYKKIYIPLEKHEIDNIISNKTIGYIIQNNKKYEVTFSFEKSEDYEKKEIEIYNLFSKNNIKWNTINSPYTEKIIDVYIEKLSEEIDEVSSIDSIEFNFNNLPYIENLVPVWNIFEKKIPVLHAIIPAEDRINYIYSISSEEFKSEDISFLPYKENATIKSINKTAEGEISIICNSDNILTWDFYMFKSFENYSVSSLKFNLYSNISDKIFDKFNSIIRTEAEIYRKVEVYKENSEISLKNFEIIEFYDLNKNEITSKNKFIRDEIRARKNNQVLKLNFEIKNKNIFDYETIKYIVSQVQMDFLDFDCRGSII